jgi:hypothetical protein
LVAKPGIRIIKHEAGFATEYGQGGLTRPFLNVRDYGATGDGTTNDTVAIQAAINAADASGNVLVFPPATYKCNAEIDIDGNIQIFGHGATLDFSGATGAFANVACLYAAGAGLTALPSLSSSIVAGSRTITLSSAPSVSVGDIVVIYDSADSSYSGFRTYYRAGEMAEVLSVSGSVITLVDDVYAAYASGGTVSVYKLSPVRVEMHGLRIIAKGSSNVAGLRIRYGKDCVLRDVRVENSNHSNILINQSWNTLVEGVKSDKMIVAGAGNGYAIVVANVQRLSVANCYLESVEKHSFSAGGDDYVGAIPCRELAVSDSILISSATLAGNGALDFHGNCEHYRASNCTIAGGIGGMAGNFGTVEDCNITGDGATGFYLSELVGLDFTIRGNRFFAQRPHDGTANRGYFLEISSGNLTASTTKPGTLVIENNTVRYEPNAAEGGTDHGFITIRNGGCVQKLSVIVRGNEFVREYVSGIESKAIYIDVSTGNEWDYVEFSGNFLRGFGADIREALEVVVRNNTVLDASYHGLSVIGSTSDVVGTLRSVTIDGNLVRGSKYAGIRVWGDTGGTPSNWPLVAIRNNVAVENNLAEAAAGPSVRNSALDVLRATELVCRDNRLGGAQAQQDYPASFSTVTTLDQSGNQYFGTGVPQYVSVTGNTVASAATITVPENGINVWSVTGTTSITSVTASWVGRVVTLIFSGVLTFTQGSNLKLNSAAGSFVTTANDQITLACDGVNWIEISRSANAT